MPASKREYNFECPACYLLLKRAPHPGRKTVDSYCDIMECSVRLRRTKRRTE